MNAGPENSVNDLDEPPSDALRWAVVESYLDGKIHVAPIGRDSEIARGHELTLGCPCGPAIDYTGIVIHEDVQ